MKINKALVKHETRNMKWMLLYFLTIVIGGVLSFNSDLNREYVNYLTNGILSDNTVILYSVRTVLTNIIAPIGIGILLMIYLQFKDSKSLEVGNFLKGLPISNKEYYTTKFMGGFISLTIPIIILITGVLAIRTSNMSWINDIYSVSVFPEIVMKADSLINITAVLMMGYLVAISTYSFLFMVQYIVMNITAGIVIGSLVWLAPSFIVMSIGVIYNKAIETLFSYFNLSKDMLFKIEEIIVNYIQAWSYPFNTSNVNILNEIDYNPMFDHSQIIYYEGLGLKILITLAITLISIGLGYVLAKKSRVENNDSLISFRWARRLFVLGVTVCSALLLTDIALMFFGMYDSIGFIILHIIMIIGGIIGYIISKKMTRLRSN